MDTIKIPVNMKRLMKLIQGKNCSAWLTGAGIRELAAEREPGEWLIVTDAERTTLESLFPEGKTRSGEPDVWRIETWAGGGEGGSGTIPVTIRSFSGPIEEYLEKQPFTTDCFACDGTYLLDLQEGWEDAFSEVTRTVGSAAERFSREPGFILETIRYIAATGFNPEADLARAIKEHAPSVGKLDKKFITEQFQRIIVSPYAGKGVGLIRDSGLLPYIVGRRICVTMNKNEKKALDCFIKNIDGTLPILERRITVFYMGFLKKRDFTAMDFLEYGKDLRERELYAHEHMPDLYFINKRSRLKSFIYEQGYENYQFLDSISKVQCRIYELDRTPALVRHNMLEEVKMKNEAVFAEDLAIKTKDILESGITQSEERAGKLLSLLPYYVHKHPKFNTKDILLDQARKLQKNKWKEITLKHAVLRG